MKLITTGQLRSLFNDVSATTICRYRHDGLLPPPIKYSERLFLTPEDEALAVHHARMKGATDDEIRELVKRLYEARIKAA